MAWQSDRAIVTKETMQRAASPAPEKVGQGNGPQEGWTWGLDACEQLLKLFTTLSSTTFTCIFSVNIPFFNFFYFHREIVVIVILNE